MGNITGTQDMNDKMKHYCIDLVGDVENRRKYERQYFKIMADTCTELKNYSYIYIIYIYDSYA